MSPGVQDTHKEVGGAAGTRPRVLLWFRNDLRLHDHAALHAALKAQPAHVLPVFCWPDADEAQPETPRWGFARRSAHRHAWLATAVQDLAQQLAALGCPLLVCPGPAASTLPALARAVGQGGSSAPIFCEDIAAPEEQAELTALRAAGLQVHAVWHSSLLDPAQLPWPVQALPPSFTPFRQAVERHRIAAPAPLPAPDALPPWPPGFTVPASLHLAPQTLVPSAYAPDPRSSLPYSPNGLHGGERAGLAHLAQYQARGLPHSYKQTRNGLMGVDYSSKWSAWLATGALSARRILAELRAYEASQGASDGSYWLWFELLWRDYFRFLHLQHGKRLYHARGLSTQPVPAHNAQGFARWCQARTGVPLVDAAMRELHTTGYLSNRLRQVVASYLVHDLQCDWRAGAAWFEAQLVDYDVYSNQGNWLYIAGRGTDPRGGRRFNLDKQAAEHDADGTDPRGGRRFNLDKQAAEHDADGAYQGLWSAV